MKLTNRIKDVWDTGTRQATSPASRSRGSDEARPGWTEWIEQQLGSHPTLTLGLGLVVGVTIGWLIKRR